MCIRDRFLPSTLAVAWKDDQQRQFLGSFEISSGTLDSNVRYIRTFELLTATLIFVVVYHRGRIFKEGFGISFNAWAFLTFSFRRAWYTACDVPSPGRPRVAASLKVCALGIPECPPEHHQHQTGLTPAYIVYPAKLRQLQYAQIWKLWNFNSNFRVLFFCVYGL